MSVVYHFGANANLENHTLRIWLWVSVAAAVLGAILLYPLGNGFADFLFVLVKAAMVGGLLLLLLKNPNCSEKQATIEQKTNCADCNMCSR